MNPVTFCLNDYDGIGFDLDCTLAEYNVKELMKLVYNALVEFLVEKKSYGSDFFQQPYEENEYFLQKGLFMDLTKGNILKISENGDILRATHGTVPLSDMEILKQYGSSATFSYLQEYVNDPLAMINKYGKTLRASLDCFDMPCLLIFARIVDHLDRKNGNPLPEYNFWQDILAGLYHLYSAENFFNEESKFFSELRKNPSLYYHKWTPEKLAWLKEIKSKKFTFLITGSFMGFAAHTASYCIGEDWKDYFSVIVTYARKPYFFSHSHPFVKFEIEKEDMIQDELQINKIYCHGNWGKLKDLISRHTKVEHPKCVYFGDNIIQDIYASDRFHCCDSIAISLELKNEFPPSQLWGSYFEMEQDGTYWNRILKSHALCCVSSLDVMVSRPLNFQYHYLKQASSNDLEESNGYYIF